MINSRLVGDGTVIPRAVASVVFYVVCAVSTAIYFFFFKVQSKGSGERLPYKIDEYARPKIRKTEVLAFHPEQRKGDLGETNMSVPVPVNW